MQRSFQDDNIIHLFILSFFIFLLSFLIILASLRVPNSQGLRIDQVNW